MYEIQNDSELKFNIVLYIYIYIYIYVIFLAMGVGLQKAYNREAGTTDDLSGTREQNRGLGGVSK